LHKKCVPMLTKYRKGSVGEGEGGKKAKTTPNAGGKQSLHKLQDQSLSDFGPFLPLDHFVKFPSRWNSRGVLPVKVFYKKRTEGR
jgi:hypothetical protein